MSAFPEDGEISPRVSMTELPEVEGATEAEKERFLIGQKGNMKAATKALNKYLEWREELPLPLPAHLPRYGPNQRPGADKLPGWMAMLTDPETGELIRSKKSDTKIVQVFGAMCDLDFEAEDYIPATADFLNANLARDSTEKITVLVDVRPGKDWKDPAPMKFIPLIKCINAQMSINFPERCRDIVIYPMPWWAVAIFNMVKLFMDPKTASKMCMLAGPAAVDSPDPAGIEEYLDEKTCVSLNKSRLEEGLPAGMMYYPEGYEHSVVFKDTEGEKKSGGEKEVTKRITSDY